MILNVKNLVYGLLIKKILSIIFYFIQILMTPYEELETIKMCVGFSFKNFQPKC